MIHYSRGIILASVYDHNCSNFFSMDDFHPNKNLSVVLFNNFMAANTATQLAISSLKFCSYIIAPLGI